MQVKIIAEAGYACAMLGLSLSYETNTDKAQAVSLKLYDKDGGHNKFLESMCVWLDITAPRYFWQQFDTFRIAVTKQSGSTMHTLMRRPLTQDDFESPIWATTLLHLNILIEGKMFKALKNELPEGFLQRRILCTNYKTLRTIISQRMSHKLPQWHAFCRAVLLGLRHPEFVTDLQNQFENLHKAPAT